MNKKEIIFKLRALARVKWQMHYKSGDLQTQGVALGIEDAIRLIQNEI